MYSLGKGILTWNGVERRSDRYGTVYLTPDGTNNCFFNTAPSLIHRPVDASGSGVLMAVVIETRKSTHFGDLFRKIFPRTPQVGQRIKFGEGEIFFEPTPVGGLCVGLKPADGREVDWLDPRALYDAHDQTVELLFARAAESRSS
jgi:hypothetical protein